MKVYAVKTKRITPQCMTIFELLDECLTAVPEKSVVAITSKIISLCEGSVVPQQRADKEQLIFEESEYHVPRAISKYNIRFTITDNTLIPGAGIDESNAGDVLILWPRDSQKTANDIREYLVRRFGLQEVGVIITDSTCRPLRQGVSGIALSFSGFKPLRNYVGEPDLFGRPFVMSQADISGGLAAAAVMVMGEGAESTPVALLSELDFVSFVPRNPTKEELHSLRIPLEDDLFEPFINGVEWERGGRRKS